MKKKKKKRNTSSVHIETTPTNTLDKTYDASLKENRTKSSKKKKENKKTGIFSPYFRSFFFFF
jgi:hypothetical protein